MNHPNVEIHPTAIVHPKAQLGAGSKVGPFSIIDENVKMGENCEIQDHVVLKGMTTLGNQVRIFPFAVVGTEPQHLKYNGEPTTVEIGDRVVLRESVTVHRGTEFGGGKTVIGDDGYFMAYSHVAHDCIIGKKAIVCNTVQLAGHVIVGDSVIIGGASEVAQFCRVGSYCYVGGGSTLRKDLPPFLVGKDNEFKVQGINVVGLERHGYAPEAIQRLRKLYKIFYMQGLTVSQAIEKVVTDIGETDEVKVFLDFVRSSKVGFIR